MVCALTQLVHIVTARLYGPENSIHIEVLLPAFVVGMLMKHKEIDTAAERRITTGISFVGLSMPLVTGAPGDTAAATSVTGSQPMMPWGTLALHVLAVSLLSNLGKLVPLFFYRDRKISERLALSIGMFTRGEVGAGVIFIALGYSLGGPALIISGSLRTNTRRRSAETRRPKRCRCSAANSTRCSPTGFSGTR